jgi:hypothetical protein
MTSARLALELLHREVLDRIDQIDHRVGNAPALGSGRLGRPDVHAPVHLHRVEGEDATPDPPGDLQRHRTLARGGRTDDHEQLVQTGLPTR